MAKADKTFILNNRGYLQQLRSKYKSEQFSSPKKKQKSFYKFLLTVDSIQKSSNSAKSCVSHQNLLFSVLLLLSNRRRYRWYWRESSFCSKFRPCTLYCCNQEQNSRFHRCWDCYLFFWHTQCCESCHKRRSCHQGLFVVWAVEFHCSSATTCAFRFWKEARKPARKV